MNNKNILEILILTRNHEQFIEKCIRSVLEQECSYTFGIIVLDDNSTDNTFAILNGIRSLSPANITLIQNPENSGVIKSASSISKLASAKYICFMDGDDQWCYPKKIQTQLDFLEQNPDFAGTFHDAYIHHHYETRDAEFLKQTQNEWKTYSQFNRYREIFMPWDLINRNIIPTASLIFRYTDHIVRYINNFKLDVYSLSWAIHLEIIKNSRFKYFNEPWSIYNDHPLGISKKHDLVEFKQNNIKILEDLLNDEGYIFYKSDICRSICREFFFMLKSRKALEMDKSRYFKLVKTYKKYLKRSIQFDIEQLTMDFNHVWSDR